MTRLMLAATVLLSSLALAADAPKAAAPAAGGAKWMGLAEKGTPLFATMVTTEGTIVLQLFSKDAPKTVANFVGLAMGEKATAAGVKKHFYDGIIFHRVIPNFMIQGGDPEGSGRGGPGYKFEDEFQSGRGFDKVGLLAMANAGPGTNGSQFFITTSTPTYLNNRHTIFGEVVQGYDVVEKISNVERLPGDRPVKEVVIKSLTISDKGPAKAPAPKAAAAAEPAKEKK